MNTVSDTPGMHDHHHDRPFPRGALIGAAALIGFSLLAVTLARFAGLGPVTEPMAPVVQSRELRFADRADGAVLVYDRQGDEVVDLVPPGSGGFVRGVLRALARERRLQGDGASTPFRLSRLADGRLTLEDLATGRVIDLKAFGHTNEGAFAQLLSPGNATP
ncbi:MAG TPA: photosynthetic complex assembly protein PuhC [Chromatiaceae bacterium]|nr:photosynthetic complex assembly protein PuhC [Chromatiaceae bacterium]